MFGLVAVAGLGVMHGGGQASFHGPRSPSWIRHCLVVEWLGRWTTDSKVALFACPAHASDERIRRSDGSRATSISDVA